ncbi:LEAF RUST 10 DISEASE-RESISTANCE LOCUS RECEPTOR-LIKE PROTEIN KINASE-like 1.1 isoform X2 [Magnolia sinica]|uniref:LEAF RUST 10 DISEASE-RESISTANCE LOCUS RECEPTOR-LIKE PROTEIN KINASE-like 1.1 isoform X2 n=1 Tax=Magnolia sinica TaxID=86752 RepID=UPI002657D530|nr:LEAF RUST 10 DISEASE-RESISTANCE LOCUS RECEPTOR-LIKE PROTEIN KINASE-like 1.1 isoform X2 [Magnolia sinica]
MSIKIAGVLLYFHFLYQKEKQSSLLCFMATPFSYISFFLLSSFLFYSPSQEHHRCAPCKSFSCGVVPKIEFPFNNITHPECGVQPVECVDNKILKIQFEKRGRPYIVKSISYESRTVVIQDDELARESQPKLCNCLRNFTVPTSHFLSFKLTTPNYTFLNCKPHQYNSSEDFRKEFSKYMGCKDSVLYFRPENQTAPPQRLRNCSLITFPVSEWFVDPYRSKMDLVSLLAAGFSLGWNLTHECHKCYEEKRGLCGWNHTTGNFICSNSGRNGGMDKKKIIVITIGAGALVLFLALLVFLLFRRIRNKNRPSISSNLLSRSISSDPYSKSELEKGIQTQFFEYKELEEATNNFDPSKELGDGGFGTVYHGKLRDGRFVAVKRLYENNYKRVEQFKNEIDILSRLRHRNLVTLYGCSSRHRRELLLVYEFIPNGTVADHLHGDRVQAGTLTWSIRMSIAVETADALAYLHKVEIIHRDVKTNNILLDNNFCVKVADFGLSRLFPLDVTHVSTAPQGTPGYVDPDYHRCYQLTDRSDVYSFGVVLIELISSMPAVDISRHRHEINLASMAITKIHNNALHELVDSTLGFDSDFSVRRMITSVAQLAFRCLQEEKEVRPSMEEVLEELRGIESEEYKVEKIEEVGIPVDETALLKNNLPPSPDTVTKAWDSRTTTPNTSG